MTSLQHDGREIELDARGYLCNAADWSIGLAEQMASDDGIVLTLAHWEIINLLREHHESFGLSPPMRLLVKEVGRRFGVDKANSRYLYRLFPEGPAKQACRYAGLPKPVSCI